MPDHDRTSPMRAILNFRTAVNHMTMRVLLLVFALTLASCGPGRGFGVSGRSFVVSDQFVIVNYGYSQGDVSWIVVRNWPATSTPEHRLTDLRFVLDPDGVYVVRQATDFAEPETGTVYFFDVERLVTFPFRMREDDLSTFRPEQFKSYSDVESYLRRFEIK